MTQLGIKLKDSQLQLNVSIVIFLRRKQIQDAIIAKTSSPHLKMRLVISSDDKGNKYLSTE